MFRPRRHRTAIAISAALATVACAAPLAMGAHGARSHHRTADHGARVHERTADHLRALERAHLSALVAADTAAAGRLMAPDFQAINPAGAVLTRADFLGAIGSGGLDFLSLEPSSPIAVRLAGRSATLRYRTSFDLVVGGTRLTHEGWTTLLYERRQGGWRIVWQQTTAVPNDPALLIAALKPRG